MAEKTRQVEPFDVLKGLDAADGHSIEKILTAIVHCVPTEQLLKMYEFISGTDIVSEYRHDKHGSFYEDVRLTK
jgi:hypothetical protein